MNNDLRGKITEKLLEKGLKLNSITVHVDNIDVISRMMYKSDGYGSLGWLRISKPVIGTLLDSELADSTQITYLTSIICVLKNCFKDIPYEKYYKTRTDLRIQVNKDKPEYSENDFLSLEEIEEVSVGLLDFRNNIDYVIWNLYTLLPPRRCEDYCKMIISSNCKNDQSNYILRDGNGFKSFVFCRYKCCEKYGKQEFTREYIISRFINGQRVIDILDIYLMNKKNGDYFIRNMSPNCFTHYFNKLSYAIIRKKTTVNLMRKMYIHRFIETNPFRYKINTVKEFMGYMGAGIMSVRKMEQLQIKKGIKI